MDAMVAARRSPDRRVSQDWKSIFSICQTQDRPLEDDEFSIDSIWSEVVGLK